MPLKSGGILGPDRAEPRFTHEETMPDPRVRERMAERISDGWWLGVCLASFLTYLVCSASVCAFVHEIARLYAKSWS